jgi:hypothetical protein
MKGIKYAVSIGLVSFFLILLMRQDVTFYRLTDYGRYEITQNQFIANWNEDDGDGYEYFGDYYSAVESVNVGRSVAWSLIIGMIPILIQSLPNTFNQIKKRLNT